jgi:hypothetical protein
LCAARGAALAHALAAVLATIGANRLTLGGGDVSVIVGIHAGEAGFGPRPGLGDHYRTAAGGTMRTAMGAARTPVGAGFGPAFKASVELGLADHAVMVSVEAVEAGLRAPGAAGLTGCAALFTGDGAVAVRVRRGEALNAGVDELCPAEATVAIGIDAESPGLRTVRRLLGDGDAAGGEGQGGQSARQKGLSHVDVSMAARRGRTSLSGE